MLTAVDAERDAILAAAGAGARVVTAGVGPAAAAATAAAALAQAPAELVVCAGIGGGFVPMSVGGLAVASRIVFADLGAETAAGFRSASELGFGRDVFDVEPALALDLADRTGGHLGTILTVATVTGTSVRAAALAGRFPDAVAEGMEGAGIAAAGSAAGVAFAEVRAISNTVGPRDRDAWRIPEALAALGTALAAVLAGA